MNNDINAIFFYDLGVSAFLHNVQNKELPLWLLCWLFFIACYYILNSTPTA
jgi:hypothetical protein